MLHAKRSYTTYLLEETYFHLFELFCKALCNITNHLLVHFSFLLMQCLFFINLYSNSEYNGYFNVSLLLLLDKFHIHQIWMSLHFSGSCHIFCINTHSKLSVDICVFNTCPTTYNSQASQQNSGFFMKSINILNTT